MHMLMRARLLVKMAACLALSLSLTACQTAGGGGEMGSQSGQRSRLVAQTDDYRRTIVEGASLGFVVGGLGTALVTAAAGGSSRDVLRNGLIGAAIGGAVGGLAGKSVADRKQQYVAKEDSLGAVIRQARANNAKLSSMTSTAQALVRQRRSEAAALKQASDARKQGFVSSLGDDQQALSGAISASRREIDQLKSLKERYGNNASINGQIGAAEAKQRALIDARQSIGDLREQLK